MKLNKINMTKIRLFDIDDDGSEVFKISLVDEPAVNIGMVFMSEQKPKPFLALSSDEKRMVYSCALRCNYPIYRYDEDFGEYYIRFSEKTVENLSKKFMMNGFQSKWSTDHSEDVQGLTVVESWIVKDANMDKFKALGMDSDIGVGDWIVGCYVDNDEVWERVKNGEFGGFSVEAYCDLSEVNKFHKETKNNMNIEANETFWSQLKQIFNEALGKEEPMAEEEEVPTEEVPTEEPSMVEEIVEEVASIVEETSEEPKEDLQAIVDALQEKVDALAKENEELKASNEELKQTNEKLSMQPSAKKVNVESNSSDTAPSFLDFASGRIKF